MKVEIMGRKNYSINSNIEEVVESKIAKLEKYFGDDANLKVILKKEGAKACIEISINVSGCDMRAQALAENMYDAIDEVIPKIERQIRKHKTRLEKRLKQTAFEEVYEEPAIPFSTSVVKEKEFALKPISRDEAIHMLDILDHDFYVYLSEETGAIQVIYRRHDGDYGLIKPKIQ